MNDLLPANSATLERALAASAGLDLLPVELGALWSAERCPVAYLPYLAWTLQVDFWSMATTEAQQRALIAGAIALHKKRGTPWAIKNALAAIGFPDCELVEHSQLHSEWLAAGGELLDGADDLDGAADLSAPGRTFRFTTNHWAEYALRLNAADSAATAEMQRQLQAVCAAYAPARSRLAAILLFAAAQFTVVPQLDRYSARGRLRLAECRRISVPSFDTLDGCDLLGGETLTDTLDGLGSLDGTGDLVPERYTGEPLDAGQLSIAARARIALCGTALGGNRQEPPETLDSTAMLDGAYTIAGETLDGHGLLDSGTLRYPTLGDPENALDGTSNLGALSGPDHTWFSGLVRIRRGSTTTQEPL